MAAADQTSKKLQKSYFDVLGLCCSSEVPLIENALKNLQGVKEITVIVPSRTVIVVHDNLLISQIQIVKALNQARLEANVRVYGDTSYKKKWPSPYVVACGLLLLLSFLKYVYHPLGWLAVVAVVVGIPPIVLKGYASVRHLRLDVNVLIIIAVIGTIAMKDYLEAGTIVFLFTIAEWLESRASHKATAVMSSLMSIAPQKAVIAESGEVVKADEVKVNTIVAVKAGEVIPIDGIVVEGRCEVDEKTLTGESFPVSKQKDSIVWAGTINLNGYISVKTAALAEDCVVAKMAKLVEEAQNSKSKTQRIIDRCAKYYTPAVVIISASIAVVPLALRLHNRNQWFHLALVVLVSACPCALILSTPVATFCALSKAATLGLLVKGGDHLEVLAKIKIMAFDKTGTITRGEFVVTNFRSLHSDISLNTLLYWVSSIESKSSHPMADALVDYGKSFSIEPKPENVEEFQNFPGEGICGTIDGRDVYIGNKKIGIRAGCEIVPSLEGDKHEGKTIGYIYSGTTPAGVFSLSDACRTGVLEAVKELKLLGIKTAMLTGDCHAAAMQAQAQLGDALDVVHSELLPEDKATIITEFKKEGPVGMVGDGVNDAPALATADIGISMGVSGSALATETGNLILMSNDIRKIPKAIQIARKTNRKVIENIILSISTKAAILALAIAGHPLVWAAVLADVGTCLLVIFNSMLLLRGSSARNHGHKHAHTHEHGCKDNSHSHSHSHSAHSHKHCCSSDKAPKKCEPHSSSCADNKCKDLINYTSSHSAHNHEHNNCCSNVKAPKVCENQKCCSEAEVAGPCASNKCTDSADGHASSHASHKHEQCCSGHQAPPKVCEPQSESCASKCHSGHQDFITHSHNKCPDSGENTSNTSSHTHKHCCSHDIVPKPCETQRCSSESSASTCHSKCTDSAGRHESCAESDEIHEVNQCCSVTPISGSCHKDDHSTTDAVNHICDREEEEEEKQKTINNGCHSHLKLCCESHGEHHHKDIKALETILDQKHNCHNHHDHLHQKRRIDVGMGSGCCRRSYMKECCGNHGHGHMFGGCLSEIITE